MPTPAPSPPVNTPAKQPVLVEPSAAPAPPPPTPPTPVIGTVLIPAGLVALGGVDGVPPRKVAVETFFILETEVTNQQYQEFITATRHAAPSGWANGNFPVGAAMQPVTNVSWHDANDFCAWYSAKIGAKVRLPTEAEWLRAAQGDDNLTYPWGKDWQDNVAASKQTGGKIFPVKSFPAGRSSYGVYDLAGNVWEWTNDVELDAQGAPKADDKGQTRRIIKGGSADEDPRTLILSVRKAVPPTVTDPLLGFRYIVVPNSAPAAGATAAGSPPSASKP
ncbi:MAG: SUMF1/EgtB/PvdO family nonheme iron enzyme [Chloracidobacterium sp.]